jgi:hypothetical protein
MLGLEGRVGAEVGGGGLRLKGWSGVGWCEEGFFLSYIWDSRGEKRWCCMLDVDIENVFLFYISLEVVFLKDICK